MRQIRIVICFSLLHTTVKISALSLTYRASVQERRRRETTCQHSGLPGGGDQVPLLVWIRVPRTPNTGFNELLVISRCVFSPDPA